MSDTEIVAELVEVNVPLNGVTVPANVPVLDGVYETEVVGVASALNGGLCDNDDVDEMLDVGEAVDVGEVVDGGVGDTVDVALAAAPTLKVVVAVAETVGVREDETEFVGDDVLENDMDAVGVTDALRVSVPVPAED